MLLDVIHSRPVRNGDNIRLFLRETCDVFKIVEVIWVLNCRIIHHFIISAHAGIQSLDGKYVRYRALSTYGTATFKGTYRTGTVRYIFFFKFLESTSVNYLWLKQ